MALFGGEGGANLGGLVGSAAASLGRFIEARRESRGGSAWSIPNVVAGQAVEAQRGILGGAPQMVYRATQPGAPSGTGSGVGQPTARQAGVDPFTITFEVVLRLLDYLTARRLSRRTRTEVSYLPYFLSPSPGGDYGYSDPFSVGAQGVGALAQGAAALIASLRGNRAMPGGMSFVPTQQGTVGSYVGGLVEAVTGGSACPTAPFASAAASGVRSQHFVVAHPVTGRAVWFKPAGRPILWSGDLSACRRVRKVAGRARRRLGGR